MTQQPHSLAQIHAPQASWQRCLQTWEQPRCLSTGEWVKKMWCSYTMEYYSAIKRNEMELLVETWTDLECHTE